MVAKNQNKVPAWNDSAGNCKTEGRKLKMNLPLVQTVTVIALIAFVCLMIAIGLFSWKKTQAIEGFLLGGRNIGPWVSAFAYGTSYFSAVIFIGYAGKHGWDIGLGSMWIGVGNAVLGCWLAWKLLAKRTRSMTHTLAAKTMPEFFEGRYNSTAFKVISALIIFIFLVPYSAAVYKGLGSMFTAIFPGVQESTWMLIIAVVTAVYLMLGGYVAAAYTDFVQGLIMIFGVFAMVIAIVNNQSVGGFGEFYQNLAGIPDNGDGIDGSQLTNLFGGSSWKFLCINILLTSFGTWGLPQMVSKYYAIKDDKSIKTATIVSTLFALIIGAGAYFIGSLSRLILNNQLPEGGHDAVIPTVLTQSLGGSLGPIIILAMVLLLLLSASMSTLSSVVLSSASAISIDLAPVVHKNYTQKQEMRFTRFLCLLFVALSYIFATQNITIIVNIMSFSWGIVSGCFIGPYVWGIYSKRTTKAGAWAGMICGFFTVLIATVVLTAMNAGDAGLYSAFQAASAMAPEMGVAAMVVSLIAVPVVSMFTKKFDEKHIAKVFSK